MCSSLCLKLNEILSVEDASNLATYLSKLGTNAAQCITSSKVSEALGIQSERALHILMAAVEVNVLTVEYAIRCPECGLLIQRLYTIDEIPNEEVNCYDCYHTFFASPENIEVLFRFNRKDFFPIGQSENLASSSKQVAQTDTLMTLLQSDLNLNHLFYKPNDSDYAEFQRMFADLPIQRTNTKQIGDALEKLFLAMLNCVQGFSAASISTSTNQIDCYVRNAIECYLPYIGRRIVVECKNENKKPNNTYYHKLTGIIDGINGPNNKIVRLGIIVSIKPPTKTIRELAVLRYARDNLVIIAIDRADLDALANNRVNLLEMIERKHDEIITNATSSLKDVGVFSA